MSRVRFNKDAVIPRTDFIRLSELSLCIPFALLFPQARVANVLIDAPFYQLSPILHHYPLAEEINLWFKLDDQFSRIPCSILLNMEWLVCFTSPSLNSRLSRLHILITRGEEIILNCGVGRIDFIHMKDGAYQFETPPSEEKRHVYIGRCRGRTLLIPERCVIDLTMYQHNVRMV
jgi:hypothetical protein